MTDKQLAANRANAEKSTGPRSNSGKRRSSLNATRHSLTGKIHIATPEECESFNKHCKAYHEELAPVGNTETELVQEIAEDRWRLKRARSLENSIFAKGHQLHVDSFDSGHQEVDAALAEGETWLHEAHSFQLITLYESRIRRAVEKNTIQLEAKQAARRQAHAKAQDEAVQLSELADAEGETYEPGVDFLPAAAHGGFVFSARAIARVIDRRDRLDRAWRLQSGQLTMAVGGESSEELLPEAV